MQPTFQQAALNLTLCQRHLTVRTGVIDCVDLAFGKDDGDGGLTNDGLMRLAVAQVGQRAQTCEGAGLSGAVGNVLGGRRAVALSSSVSSAVVSLSVT